ncbi:MAG TPA: hypothetical protein VFP86_05930 [bacterium]|nr:hypothetical protein [bacterium]
MQKLLAVAVLGASLVFATSAAFADERGVVEPVSPATQQQTILVENQTDMSTVAGGAPVSVVDTSRENGSNR